MTDMIKVKNMVYDMETIETLVGNKGRFVGNMTYISIEDLASCIRKKKHEELKAIADKMAKALEKIAQRPNIPNPERDADWKNCMKLSAYEAQQALTEYKKLKGE